MRSMRVITCAGIPCVRARDVTKLVAKLSARNVQETAISRQNMPGTYDKAEPAHLKEALAGRFSDTKSVVCQG